MKLLDTAKINDELLKEKEKVYGLKLELREIQYKFQLEGENTLKNLKEELLPVENQSYILESEVNKLSFAIKTKEADIVALENSIAALRKNWGEINLETLQISEELFICPTCKRALDHEDISNKKEELESNFNLNKFQIYIMFLILARIH